MRFKICSLILILAVNVQAAWPQTSQNAGSQGRLDAQWRGVQALAVGERVKVQRVKGKEVEGTVVTITEDALTAMAKSGAVTIPRSDVREVKVKSASQQGRNALIGASIGAASGVTLAAVLDGALTDGNGMSGSAAVFFAAIGTATGYTVRKLRPAYRTIYKAA